MKPCALFGLAALVLSACAHAAPTSAQVSCTVSSRARADAAQTMRDMYAALMIEDLDAFHAVTTQDFFAYDAGQSFDGDALMDLIKDRHAQGVVFEWNVNDPKVEVVCDTALVTYVNTGSIMQADLMRPMKWLESATLRHDGESWRIRFFHSTAVPAPARPQ